MSTNPRSIHRLSALGVAATWTVPAERMTAERGTPDSAV